MALILVVGLQNKEGVSIKGDDQTDRLLCDLFDRKHKTVNAILHEGHCRVYRLFFYYTIH